MLGRAGVTLSAKPMVPGFWVLLGSGCSLVQLLLGAADCWLVEDGTFSFGKALKD